MVITDAVQILKSDDDFGREETDRVLGEHFPGLPFQQQEQLPTGTEIGNQADMRLRLQNNTPKSSPTKKL
jgi:hypothetical protein